MDNVRSSTCRKPTSSYFAPASRLWPKFATCRVIRAGVVGGPKPGKWPRHGERFDATMNTIQIQADVGKRSIDGGFYSRRCWSRSPRGFLLLHPTIEGQNSEHTVNYKAQWSTRTGSKDKKLPTVRPNGSRLGLGGRR
jgi:hypothetical protein